MSADRVSNNNIKKIITDGYEEKKKQQMYLFLINQLQYVGSVQSPRPRELRAVVNTAFFLNFKIKAGEERCDETERIINQEERLDTHITNPQLRD